MTISGTAQENQVLTASNTLADADGLGTISYQWQRDAAQRRRRRPARTYTLGNADVGHTIDVVASYTDGHGTRRASPARRPSTVTNVNDAPTGDGDDQRHRQREPGPHDLEHAGRRRRARHDQLSMAARRRQRRRRNRGHLYARQCRCRPHHRRGGELHRRPRHGGEQVKHGHRDRHQCQRRANRHGDHQRHRAGEPGPHGLEHAGGRRRARHDQLPMAARRRQRGWGHGTAYTLGNADVGHTIDVVVSYTDGHGTAEASPAQPPRRSPMSTTRRPER